MTEIGANMAMQRISQIVSHTTCSSITNFSPRPIKISSGACYLHCVCFVAVSTRWTEPQVDGDGEPKRFQSSRDKKAKKEENIRSLTAAPTRMACCFCHSIPACDAKWRAALSTRRAMIEIQSDTIRNIFRVYGLQSFV